VDEVVNGYTPSMKANELTQELLKAHIEYDPDTGLFRRTFGCWRTGVEWYAGCPNNCGHLRIWFLGHLYQAHRLAWLYITGAWPKHEIDHINGVKTDNRFANLRDVTRNINQQNLTKPMKSKKSCQLIGAYWNHDRWMAIIKVDKKQIYLGRFDTPEEAHAAYVGAKRVMHPGGML
tara:strand:- start:59 stop:586 length:528 start_codon:yes stop_codon:yes gene_type:complete